MKVEQVLSKDLKREYNITVPAGDIAAKVEKKLTEISKTAKLPGFRPGKVPLEIVKKNYGGSVMGEILEQVIDQSSIAAINQEKLKPAFRPNIEIVDFKEGSDLKFKMKLEILPDVPKIDFAKIAIERPKVEVGEGDIAEALDRIAAQMKNFVAVKDGRAAKKGDAVLIDFKGFVDDKAFAGGEAHGHRLQLGSNAFIPGFEDQLIGTKAGDKKDVHVTFPELYHSKDLAGKKAKFEVKIHEVQEESATKIDDEFAKKLGYDNLSALKDAVKAQVEMEVESVCRSDAKKALFDVLDKQVKFNIPEEMMNQEFKAVWGTVENAKKSTPDAPEFKGKSDDDLKKEYREMAERRVRLGIFLADVGVSNSIKVTGDDLNRAVLEEAKNFPGQEQRVFEHYKKHPEQIDALRGPILEDKVVDFLLGKVTVKEKKMSLKELKASKEEGKK